MNMLGNIYDLMQTIKFAKRRDLGNKLKISRRLKDLSKYVSNVINFIQLNQLALKQTLSNIEKEFRAFESKAFLQFFNDYYNQKDSMLKRFFEHPGTLRAFFQMKYLVEVVRKGLQQSLAQNEYEMPVLKKNSPKPKKKILKKKIFSYSSNMDEMSTFKNVITEEPQLEFETNEVSHTNGISLGELVEEIESNLDSVNEIMKIQTHFFRVHENKMLKQMDIRVQTYYNIEDLNEKAYYNFSNNNLDRETFIKVTVEYDQQKEKKIEKECYSMLDLYLVYLHTFLYLLNYYGLAQTSPDYSEALDLDASISGVLQAASPAAALFFGFFINCITKTKYRFPYLLCLGMLVVGNFLYFLAAAIGNENQTWGIICLVTGRMIFGSGGSRLMTRKFIAINVPSIYQSKYSTYLVGFSALGITLGPGISSVFEFISNTSFSLGNFNVPITTYNILSLVFFLVWFFLFFFFMIFFKGYDVVVERNLKEMYENEQMLNEKYMNLDLYYRGLGSKSMMNNLNMVGKNKNNFLESGLVVNPTFNVEKKNLVNTEGYAIYVPGTVSRKKPEDSSFRVFFPNVITFYSLWCFLIFKIIQEAYFTEQPQMFKEYYDYKSQIVGWFMLSLTFVGVPTALLTGAATKKYEDRKILLIGFILYIIGCVSKINFEFDKPQPFAQYIIASAILFIASLVGEAAAISILAKVISPSLKLGFFNAGLLSGTADTIGRALGNSSMTLFGNIL